MTIHINQFKPRAEENQRGDRKVRLVWKKVKRRNLFKMIGEEGDPLLKEDQDKNKENEHVQVNQFSKEDSRNFNSF